jgi:hypothetical protein
MAVTTAHADWRPAAFFSTYLANNYYTIWTT